MINWWVCGEEVVSPAVEGIGCPANFTVVEGADLPRDEVFFDGQQILAKPEKPGENYYWSEADKTWVEIPEKIPLKMLDWNGFLLGIIQTPVYEKIKNFLGANDPAEYTVLVALLNNSALPDADRERLLENALRRVKAAMKGSSTPLTSKDVATINELLASKLLVDWNLNG